MLLSMQPTECYSCHQSVAAAIRVLQLPSECCSYHQSAAAAIRMLQLPSECSSCNQSAAAAIRVLQLQSECCSCNQSVAAAIRVLQQLSSVSYLSTSNITTPCTVLLIKDQKACTYFLYMNSYKNLCLALVL